MQHVKTYFCSYSQCWSSPSNFATSWDNLASVSRMQGQNSSAISSTMKGTKNLVKTFSYSIQRRAVSKFYASLVRILFHHSSWQRLTIHFFKIPCKKNKREDRTGIGQHYLNSVCEDFTWLDCAIITTFSRFSSPSPSTSDYEPLSSTSTWLSSSSLSEQSSPQSYKVRH